MIRWLVITVGVIIIGLSAAPLVLAQSSETFREVPPPSNPRPRPAPTPEHEPVIAAPQPWPTPFPYDGTWVGVHRCPEFNNRQAFQHSLIMQIKNSRASAVTDASAGTPGYITFDGVAAPSGKLTLHGYAISRGQPGASPAGTQFPFDYDGAIAGDMYTAHALGSRPCTIELYRQH